MDKIYLL